MNTMHTEARIGEAWSLHRAGKNVEAIRIYDEILRKAPKNIDALYGMGLAKRAESDLDGAVNAFQQALDLAKSGLDATDTTATIDGHLGANNLDSYEDDRFLMLRRMIQQRLEEIESSR